MTTSTPPSERNFSALIAVVAATITLAGAALTTIGISAGVITGLLRNDTLLTSCFLSVALLGVLLGVLSAFIGNPDPSPDPSESSVQHGPAPQRRAGPPSSANRRKIRRWSGALAIIGVLLLFVGVGLVVWRAATALKTTSRPSIAVTVTPLDKPAGYATLQAKVTASGLTTHERYFIHAELLDKQQHAANLPVFTTFVGPGADGKLDYTFKVQFPIDPRHPWIAVTAQLGAENTKLATTQACGLPEQSPSPRADSSPSPSPISPQTGTTCVIALAPTPSATPAATPTGSSSPPA